MPCTTDAIVPGSGSAPLLIETFNEWKHRTGHAILERYGMSETIMLTSNPCAC
jgi:malonyl-CoA/methylmalonyl-CoA synthetase